MDEALWCVKQSDLRVWVVRVKGLEPSTPNRTLAAAAGAAEWSVGQQDDSLPCMPFHHTRVRVV